MEIIIDLPSSQLGTFLSSELHCLERPDESRCEFSSTSSTIDPSKVFVLLLSRSWDTEGFGDTAIDERVGLSLFEGRLKRSS